MILQRAHVNAAMSLTASDVSCALNRNGYEGDVVQSAKFVGLTPSRNFSYECRYNDEGVSKIANVYIKYDAFYNLVAEY